MNIRPVRSWLIIALLALAACTTTVISGSWLNESYQPLPVTSVLILGTGDDDMARRIYEQDMVKRLRSLGIEAQSSFNLFPDESPLGKDKILTLARGEGLDTLLVTRVTRKKNASQTRTYTTGNVYFAPRFSLHHHHPYDHYPYYYDWYGYYYFPGATTTTYSYEYLILSLETNLYAIDKGELIWSAELEAVHESRISATVQDINRATLNQMIRDGVIRRR